MHMNLQEKQRIPFPPAQNPQVKISTTFLWGLTSPIAAYNSVLVVPGNRTAAVLPT
jgi:hypothetical protein